MNPTPYRRPGVRPAETQAEANRRRRRRAVRFMCNLLLVLGLFVGCAASSAPSSNPAILWAAAAVLVAPWIWMCVADSRRWKASMNGRTVSRPVKWDLRVCATCGRGNKHGHRACTKCGRILATSPTGQERRFSFERR